MNSLCIFCGSSTGFDSIYASAARAVGTLVAHSGMTLVYGGGSVGLMGIVADAAMAAGGEVAGVIPQPLFGKEVAHNSLTKLHVVDTMHARKELMYTLSDAFMALPGGIGTLEELCEILTWGQLGLHRKPCGLLNVKGYFDPLLDLLDRAVAEGFLKKEHRAMLVVDDTPESLLKKLKTAHLPRTEKWITHEDV